MNGLCHRVAPHRHLHRIHRFFLLTHWFQARAELLFWNWISHDGVTVAAVNSANPYPFKFQLSILLRRINYCMFSDFNFRLSSSHVVLFLVCAILRTMVLFRLIYSFVAIARRTCFWWTKFTNWFRVWVIWGWGFPGCYYFLLNLNCAFLADIGVVI